MAAGRKIIVLLGDGMSDFSIAELGNKTPLEYADIPNMDHLAKNGKIGLANTVPEGLPPGSDVANLSVMGYDPEKYYTGRAPLEALNLGIELGPRDVAFRCNLVKISDGKMSDFSAGHIETPFTEEIISLLQKELNTETIEFYPGVSYRNIMVWRNYPYRELPKTTPPHDITGKAVDVYQAEGTGEKEIRELMVKAGEIIRESGLAEKLAVKYHGEPTDIWLWGAGYKPAMDSFQEKYGLDGVTISAVDLINGIGRGAGLVPVTVPGATGYIDTNYEGKVSALLKSLETSDFVYLHVEAPDESGHEGNLDHKLQAIADFDKKVVGPVIKGLEKFSDYSVIVMPDHPTPISLMTHTSEPVPFIVYHKGDNGTKYSSKIGYSENEGKMSGLFVEKAFRLLGMVLKREI